MDSAMDNQIDSSIDSRMEVNEQSKDSLMQV